MIAARRLSAPFQFWDLISGAWLQLSLVSQFTLAACPVVFIAMLAIGSWVSDSIENAVATNSAVETVLYVDSLVTPLVQDLESGVTISDVHRQALDQVFSTSAANKVIIRVKVWRPKNTVAYSNLKEIIGVNFPLSSNLEAAWGGAVFVEFNNLINDENRTEKLLGVPLLEIYAPVRSLTTHKIIAVAELYQRADGLAADLTKAKIIVWSIVAGTMLTMLSLLTLIVQRGSQTIDNQKTVLESQIDQLSKTLEQNEALRSHLVLAYNRTAEINERFLRKLGADLHDGTAQLLGLAMLRLDSLKPAFPMKESDVTAKQGNFTMVKRALSDALQEVRQISAGLVLPELNKMTLSEALHLAIRLHEQRTGTTVAFKLDRALDHCTDDMKACIYRFVQEGLNNAFRHAGGKGQSLRAEIVDGLLEVEVADKGPGFAVQPQIGSNSGLGLVGLRDRVSSLGGTLELRVLPDRGSALLARFSNFLRVVGDE